MRKIGVVTVGEDAPGMIAAIRSLVRTSTFHGLEVIGIERGYAGLIEGQVRPLGARSMGEIMNQDGTMLRTAGVSQGIQKAADMLKATGTDGLITIGGDGAFRAASEFYEASYSLKAHRRKWFRFEVEEWLKSIWTTLGRREKSWA